VRTPFSLGLITLPPLWIGEYYSQITFTVRKAHKAPHLWDHTKFSAYFPIPQKSVLVFVSEYCVVHRERFIKNCHGDAFNVFCFTSFTRPDKLIPFCKSYPSACTSTAGVIPVLTYCQRYYKHYPKFCAGPKIEQEMLQFCFAFEQFCLPELTPAKSEKHPQSSLRRCEDVLPEARRVCNPFPNPRDTFNVLRCSNFLTHCKKFVDWA
ncbi:unnamed protein product, partial [Angiostrongylus costaricensis]|uniref:FZ domain-containing protein n=1 Tax=Angiostrongylus costaricensis TaxID=334426 RepID=A0A158PMD7_ANGCS